MKEMLIMEEILGMSEEDGLMEFIDFINSIEEADDVISIESNIYEYINQLESIYLIKSDGTINLNNIYKLISNNISIYYNIKCSVIGIDTLKGVVIIGYH